MHCVHLFLSVKILSTEREKEKKNLPLKPPAPLLPTLSSFFSPLGTSWIVCQLTVGETPAQMSGFFTLFSARTPFKHNVLFTQSVSFKETTTCYTETFVIGVGSSSTSNSLTFFFSWSLTLVKILWCLKKYQRQILPLQSFAGVNGSSFSYPSMFFSPSPFVSNFKHSKLALLVKFFLHCPYCVESIIAPPIFRYQSNINACSILGLKIQFSPILC